MAQAAYLGEDRAIADLARDSALARTVSLFGSAAALAELAHDSQLAGLAVRSARPLETILTGDAGALGDVVYVATTAPGGAELAALIRLDERAERAGAEIIVATTADALEDVFGCLDRARVQFLVDAVPAERIVALGMARARLPGHRVREMDEDDRLVLLRLTQEVARLAAQLDHLVGPFEDDPDVMSARLASPGIGYRGNERRDLSQRARVSLPDPKLVHRVIRQRRLRERYFDSQLFADPAWDILLDLTAARAEHRRVGVSSLCIAAAVPATTALRWISQMTEMGLVLREPDPEDKRRAFIVLADKVADAMARYFDELGKDAAKRV